MIQIKQIGIVVPHCVRACDKCAGRQQLAEQLHPMGPHHLPLFIVSPGETDVLMVVTGLILIGAVFGVGLFYWHLHSLPERMAHKSQKLQFEIVAVLGLISLFTHEHIYWIAGLLLALIDLPDFSTPLRSIADSVEKIADGGSPASDVGEPEAAASAGQDAQDAQDAQAEGHSHA